MRKINLSKVNYPKGYTSAFSLDDMRSCLILWESLLRFSDGIDKKVDVSTEVSLALSIASRPYCGKSFEIFQVSAEFAKNARLDRDFYAYSTNDMDVWITVKALSEFDGFYIVGFYLSDIWQVSCSEQSWDECHDKMFIRKFVEK